MSATASLRTVRCSPIAQGSLWGAWLFPWWPSWARKQARGYQLTMGSLLALSVVFFLIAFAVSKERIQPDAHQKTSVGRDLGDLVANGPWITLFLVTVFYFTALLIRGNVMLPYFENCAGNRILFSWFNGFGLIALLSAWPVPLR